MAFLNTKFGTCNTHYSFIQRLKAKRNHLKAINSSKKFKNIDTQNQECFCWKCIFFNLLKVMTNFDHSDHWNSIQFAQIRKWYSFVATAKKWRNCRNVNVFLLSIPLLQNLLFGMGLHHLEMAKASIMQIISPKMLQHESFWNLFI